LAKDLGYGDALQLMYQLEEVCPPTAGLKACTSSILSRLGGTDFWLLSSYKKLLLEYDKLSFFCQVLLESTEFCHSCGSRNPEAIDFTGFPRSRE
jgi:hypothetical protein